MQKTENKNLRDESKTEGQRDGSGANATHISGLDKVISDSDPCLWNFPLFLLPALGDTFPN